MNFRRSSPDRRAPGWLLVMVLLVLLGLSGVLAYEAQDAARSHRAAVEAALQDYASFATWQFSRRVSAALGVARHQTLHPLFVAGSHTVPAPVLPGLEELAALHGPPDVECGALRVVDAYFRFDPGSRELATNPNALPADVVAWLADTLAAVSARPPRGEPVHEGLLFDQVGDRRLMVGYAVVLPARSASPLVLGFVSDAAMFAHVCDDLFPGAPLLPPSLTGSVGNDSILSVELLSASGISICASPVQYASAFFATDTLVHEHGGLVVQATLRPEAAGFLMIGGLPASRLPLLIGLLMLTAGLAVAALIHLRREQELARLREDFVSGVSHELRTPLAQIRMFAESLVLGRIRGDGERLRSLEVIDREARRLSQLVDNVLRFSGDRRGATRIAPEPAALGTLVGEVVEAFEPLAAARRVGIRLDLEPGIAVVVDRDAFEQILLNLLDNAVKYGPEGQTVTIAAQSVGDAVHLRVDDQGPGVPARDRERIWRAFNRLDRDVDAAVTGTGIGLAVVRVLAGLHGATAQVEDAPSGGARFVVVFPSAWRMRDARSARAPGRRGVA